MGGRVLFICNCFADEVWDTTTLTWHTYLGEKAMLAEISSFRPSANQANRSTNSILSCQNHGRLADDED